MEKKFVSFLLFTLVYVFAAQGQVLQPGFDGKEYINALSMAFGKYDSMTKINTTSESLHFNRIYNSKVVGLDNRWNLWVRNDGKEAVINIRGTVPSMASWLANIYSAMVPATGTIKINDSTTFNYQLAATPNAAVHVGWLISLSSMAVDIEQKIKEQYNKGVKDFMIVGHSQGGAIAFLLRSLLYYRTKDGTLPADITYKTYCSAAPKPGNLYYAYDFDFINRGGWAFRVVNAADWVPELPFSIQQISDLNPLNPFIELKTSLKKQKYIVRVYANLIFNKLNRSTRKAERKYEKHVGRKLRKRVQRVLPQLQIPKFVHSLDYTPAGTPIILLPDAAYYEQFPNDPANNQGVWIHHTFNAYYYLMQSGYLQTPSNNESLSK